MKASFFWSRLKQIAAFYTKTGDTFFEHLRVFIPHVELDKNSLQIWTSYVLVTWVPVVLSQTDLLMISKGVACTENQYCWHWINGMQIYYVWYMNIRNNNSALQSSKLVTVTGGAGPFTIYIISLLHSFPEQWLWPGKHLFLAKVYLQQGN